MQKKYSVHTRGSESFEVVSYGRCFHEPLHGWHTERDESSRVESCRAVLWREVEIPRSFLSFSVHRYGCYASIFLFQVVIENLQYGVKMKTTIRREISNIYNVMIQYIGLM
jgi:hypothetical protein